MLWIFQKLGWSLCIFEFSTEMDEFVFWIAEIKFSDFSMSIVLIFIFFKLSLTVCLFYFFIFSSTNNAFHKILHTIFSWAFFRFSTGTFSTGFFNFQCWIITNLLILGKFNFNWWIFISLRAIIFAKDFDWS